VAIDFAVQISIIYVSLDYVFLEQSKYLKILFKKKCKYLVILAVSGTDFVVIKMNFHRMR
jgi:hypothetical protein